jgi:hypothetical protein
MSALASSGGRHTEQIYLVGGNRSPLPLNLPAPRIWTPKHLAEFVSLSVSWVYKRTELSAADPIPRVPGCGRLRFDTDSPAFQSWMRRQLGYIDRVEGDE